MLSQFRFRSLLRYQCGSVLAFAPRGDMRRSLVLSCLVSSITGRIATPSDRAPPAFAPVGPRIPHVGRVSEHFQSAHPARTIAKDTQGHSFPSADHSVARRSAEPPEKSFEPAAEDDCPVLR